METTVRSPERRRAERSRVQRVFARSDRSRLLSCVAAVRAELPPAAGVAHQTPCDALSHDSRATPANPKANTSSICLRLPSHAPDLAAGRVFPLVSLI